MKNLSLGKPKESGNLKDIGADGRIILNRP
jgi:hypothetical protein